MDGISSMNLSDSDSTPLFGNINMQPPSSLPFGGGGQPPANPFAIPLGNPSPPPTAEQLTYTPIVNIPPPQQQQLPPMQMQVPVAHRMMEKYPGTPQMDSTPISDIMGSEVDYPQQGAMMGGQQQVMVQQQQPQAAPSKRGNLTPEQMDALLAGVAAVAAFSKPVQEKLAGFIPQMLTAGGEVSNIGLLITALVVALIFYFGRRFIK
jgi:hypothetical protein